MASRASADVPARREEVLIKIEFTVEITDQEKLRSAARSVLEGVEYINDPDGSEQTSDLQAIDDPAEAVLMLLDMDSALDPDCGAHALRTTMWVPHAVDLRVAADTPPFGELFPVCDCARSTCSQCEIGFQLTPRTAAALHLAAQVLADHGYDDIEAHGDEWVTPDGSWSLFDAYPWSTYGQDAIWRRQAARSYDDLAEDLAAGRWPEPRCIGEEMALRLMMSLAEALVSDRDDAMTSETSDFGGHQDDFDWESARDVLVQDTDLDVLFDPSRDGGEHPDDEANQALGMGDYRPRAWFDWFLNVEPRDGRRAFRR